MLHGNDPGKCTMDDPSGRDGALLARRKTQFATWPIAFPRIANWQPTVRSPPCSIVDSNATIAKHRPHPRKSAMARLTQESFQSPANFVPPFVSSIISSLASVNRDQADAQIDEGSGQHHARQVPDLTAAQDWTMVNNTM
jgi:hypothetical protein